MQNEHIFKCFNVIRDFSSLIHNLCIVVIERYTSREKNEREREKKMKMREKMKTRMMYEVKFEARSDASKAMPNKK